MPSIACLVEGHGDAISIPIILRRLAAARAVFNLEIAGPFRHHRQAIVRPGEFERAIDRAARSLTKPGGVLVVLDADDDQPCTLGPTLRARAHQVRPDVETRVVLAVKEKEAWYLASLDSLRGQRGIPTDATAVSNAEQIRGAKGRLSSMMLRPYSEIADQAALASLFDMNLAGAGSPSFRRFLRDGLELLAIS